MKALPFPFLLETGLGLLSVDIRQQKCLYGSLLCSLTVSCPVTLLRLFVFLCLAPLQVLPD